MKIVSNNTNAEEANRKYGERYGVDWEFERVGKMNLELSLAMDRLLDGETCERSDIVKVCEALKQSHAVMEELEKQNVALKLQASTAGTKRPYYIGDQETYV